MWIWFVDYDNEEEVMRLNIDAFHKSWYCWRYER